MSHCFSYWKDLQASDPLFVTITKQLNNTIGETFCERLKWTCKLSERDEPKDVQKPVIFSKSSTHFILEFAHGNSYHFYLPSFSDSEILRFLLLKITETTCR